MRIVFCLVVYRQSGTCRCYLDNIAWWLLIRVWGNKRIWGLSVKRQHSLLGAVVLKWVPLGSLREEFLIPGRKVVPRRNWGGTAVDQETWGFCYLLIQHIGKMVSNCSFCNFIKLLFCEIVVLQCLILPWDKSSKDTLSHIQVVWSFCNSLFCDFCRRGIDNVWICKGEYEKNFWESLAWSVELQASPHI